MQKDHSPSPPPLPSPHKRTHTFSKLEDYFSGSIFTIKQYDLFIAQVFFTDYTTRKANEMASEWSCKNQNSGFWGNRHQGKDILVQVSREFKVSKFELTE